MSQSVINPWPLSDFFGVPEAGLNSQHISCSIFHIFLFVFCTCSEPPLVNKRQIRSAEDCGFRICKVGQLASYFILLSPLLVWLAACASLFQTHYRWPSEHIKFFCIQGQSTDWKLCDSDIRKGWANVSCFFFCFFFLFFFLFLKNCSKLMTTENDLWNQPSLSFHIYFFGLFFVFQVTAAPGFGRNALWVTSLHGSRNTSVPKVWR